MAEDHGRDELIAKLDQLISRGRVAPGARNTDAPMLTESLPARPDDPVPTLTEAVAGPGRSQDRQLGPNDIERIVAMRIAESIEREVARLSGEFPSHRGSLIGLRRRIVMSLPELVRRAWSAPTDDKGRARGPLAANSVDSD